MYVVHFFEKSQLKNLAPDSLLEKMNTYSSETRHAFQKTLAWLNKWACARTYGLGSKLPWDPHFLVESLSDSTIYMSYYTVSQLLHGRFSYNQEIINYLISFT